MLLAAVFGITTGAASARSESPADPRQSKTAAENALTRKTEKLDGEPRNGIYDGTIDRIVDGEHVVILLESDGETVGEYVLDHDRVPDAEEGGSVTVWLYHGTVIAVWTD
jgi:hypothetical protein